MRATATAVLILVVSGVSMGNTLPSSTMYFQGTLTDDGQGGQTGVLRMLDEVTLSIGDGVAGFDVYGQNGAVAKFSGDPDVTMANHDGWPTWTPDTPDWYQYSLYLYVDGGQQKWALRNHAGATEANPWYDTAFWGVEQPARGVPMSGSMDWASMLALETDAGAYLTGMGSASIPGWAAANGGGAQAWDMDWSWGSEVVPLEKSGFAVAVQALGGGDYQVIMTPADGSIVNQTTGVVYATIQAAIDAASGGDTIAIAAGTYVPTAQLVIDKDVTLRGSGRGLTVLQPGFNTTVGAYLRSDSFILVETGVTATIEDLAIDGSGRTVRHAIQSRGADMTVRDCDIRNIYANTYAGRGVVFLTGTGLVENCAFSGIQRIGVHVRGAIEPVAPIATITGCTYVGKGNGDFLDYGVEIGGGGQATISNNLITDCRGVASVDGSGSAGVLATDYYGTGTVGTINGNTFFANSVGVFVGYGDTDTTVANISGNNFTGSYKDTSEAGTGIVNASPAATVNAESNWWGDAAGPYLNSPGDGDRVTADVDYDPWLAKPAQDNVLYLEVQAPSIYIQPGETIVVDMNIANLQQNVNACQAMLGYSSTFFADPTGGAVAAGGGVWNELIYDSWAIGAGAAGEIDTAVGLYVESMTTGTDVDGTVAVVTLGSRVGVEGVTQMVFRPDADPDPGLVASTYLADLSAQPVWPAKVNSTNIYIDGTAPMVDSFAASVLCTADTTELTFAVSDALAGVDQVDVYVDAAPVATDVASPYTLDLSAYGTGDYAVQIRVTDNAGNVTDSAVVPVSVDQTAPVIASVTATQGGASVLCGDGVALQGVVDIYADVSDADCAALVTPPTVTVEGMAVSYVDVAGAIFHYQVTVEVATANVAHVITVAAEDALGNDSSSTVSLCVDKNQVSGSIELEQFIGTSRDVTFVATDAGGVVLANWTVTVDDFGAGAVGTYTLTEVPAGMAGLSAKTGWNLRSKLAVALDGDGQATANFTGADLLPGGDLNGSNSVNILDYSIMKASWYLNADADIDGDGGTALLDYGLMKANWFHVGDAE